MVISLCVANFLIKQILIDNGSSTNVLFLSAFREMDLKDSDLTKRSISMVGFSGESKNTMAEITLPVYAERVIKSTKFLVFDCPFAYNIILGRP